MKRGEIWTVAGGSGYAGKPRPALIVQDDLYEATASVTVCGFTSEATEAPLSRPQLAPGPDNGLRQPSWVMVDKITTVSRARLGDRIGRLTAPEMIRVERALLLFLGLAR